MSEYLPLHNGKGNLDYLFGTLTVKIVLFFMEL